jgi:hypothetical protein
MMQFESRLQVLKQRFVDYVMPFLALFDIAL